MRKDYRKFCGAAKDRFQRKVIPNSTARIDVATWSKNTKWNSYIFGCLAWLIFQHVELDFFVIFVKKTRGAELGIQSIKHSKSESSVDQIFLNLKDYLKA